MTDTAQANPISAGSDPSDAASRPPKPRKSRPWATGPSGSAVRRPPNWTGWSPSWKQRRRCRWPPASSTSGPPAQPVAESFHRIDKAYPGRFLLGIGVGHPEAITEYRKPYDALIEYLDKLDEYGVPANRRVVAALGPQVLKLSARRSAGAHPYLTTPEHTAAGPRVDRARRVPRARTQGGADHRRREGPRGRPQGRSTIYFNLANYRNNWKRLGFTEEDVDEARQRPSGGRASSPTARWTRSRRGSRSTSPPAPTTCRCRC